MGRLALPTLVVVVDYDAVWPDQFTEVAASLRSLLGNVVCDIEHVGSTAVPGLAAKPVIDIDVTLRGSEEIAAAASCMVAAGYEARGNRYNDDMWAFSKTAAPACRVYLCPSGNETHRKRLVFRDRLRRDSDLCTAYAALKQQLSRQFPLDGDNYTAAKKHFIESAVGPLSSIDPI
jgi:GrpB-like predicted nucleotidyltransferase (UPF0157 family)